MTESEQVISDILEMEKDRIKAELEAEKEKLRLAQEELEEELDLIEELEEQIKEKDQVISFLKDLVVKNTELHLNTLDKVNTHLDNCNITSNDAESVVMNSDRPYRYLLGLFGGIIIVLGFLLWNSQSDKRHEVIALSQTIQECEGKTKEITKEIEKTLVIVDDLILQQEELSTRVEILRVTKNHRF